MNTVEQYLKETVRDIMPQCHTAHQFVYFHGQEFTPHPNRRKFFRNYGGAGQCFRNALKLVKKFPSHLTYAEGFAASSFEGQIRPHFGLHAWAVTRDGLAIDPTWSDGVEYYGVVFDLDYVVRTVAKRKEFGVIDNYQDEFPLWSGVHTDWRPEWDKGRLFREGFIPYPRREG